LLAALVQRSESLTSIVSDAVREAEIISADVGGMVTGIQFQDRTKQRLEHVIDTLHIIGEAVHEIKANTREAAPELSLLAPADMEWVKKLLSRYTMSEVRERFVAQVIDGDATQSTENTQAPSAPAEVGSVELF
jgi:methyl-accepting chemotaxis protein